MSICPSPGKQRVDVCHRPAIDDLAEDVGEVGLRIEAVKLRGFAAPAKAQDLKMAQGVDVQIGRDRSDRYDRDRRRNDATVGIGPGGVTIGPRQRCRMVTTTIERGDRTITRRGAPLRLRRRQPLGTT